MVSAQEARDLFNMFVYPFLSLGAVYSLRPASSLGATSSYPSSIPHMIRMRASPKEAHGPLTPSWPLQPRSGVATDLSVIRSTNVLKKLRASPGPRFLDLSFAKKQFKVKFNLILYSDSLN
jgi:hypothetical protein